MTFLFAESRSAPAIPNLSNYHTQATSDSTNQKANSLLLLVWVPLN
jgi:hypothetical protein